jgi:PAS domain S-box-containing protein
VTEAESRALFALLSEGASIAAIGYDPDLRVRWLNPAARTLLPLPSDIDPIGRSYSELGYPGEWSGQFREWFDRARGTDKPFFREVTLPGPNGPIRLRGGASPVIVDDELLGFVALAMDVTEFHRSAEQLAESEQRHHRIVREAGVFTWEHDHRTGRTRLEPEYLKRIGLTPQTIPENTDAWEAWFLTDEDREAARRAIADCERDQASSYEYDFRARDEAGQLRWFHVRAMPRRDAIGRTLVTEGVTIDITERHAALTALADTRALFDRFMEHCPALAWIKGPDFRYEYLNPEYERRFNLEGGTGVGRTDFDIFPRDVAEIFREHDASVLSSGLPISVTENTRDAKGRTQPWFVVKFPLPGDGDRAGVGGFAFDVSELHRLQEEQRAVERKMLDAQKLESIGVLAGGIAHDFNNLLTGILGFASLAARDPALSESVRGHLSSIERGASRAAELCGQMLAYAGRGQLVTRIIDLNSLAHEMTQLLATAISKRAVLRFNLTNDIPAIHADSTQVRQIVMNLITNASDAIGDRSGVITLSTGVIDADARYLSDMGAPHLTPARYVYLEVSDTGSGIPQDVLPKVFEPFYTTKFTGRGLGLAAVQGIVRTHGGAIKIYTQEQRGTTFKILFPAHEDTAPPTPVLDPSIHPVGEQRRVLVVDDEEDVRVLVRKTLELSGFVVETAPDGRAALDLFRTKPEEFALVLLDLTMPRLSGADTFREMRQIRPDVRVVLTSGYAREDATAGFEGKRLAGFVRKPFRVTDLLSAVTAALAD